INAIAADVLSSPISIFCCGAPKQPGIRADAALQNDGGSNVSSDSCLEGPTDLPRPRSCLRRVGLAARAMTVWTTAARFLAVLCVTGVSALDLIPTEDGLSDEAIFPPCRIGSLQSWQGRPCVVPDDGT